MRADRVGCTGAISRHGQGVSFRRWLRKDPADERRPANAVIAAPARSRPPRGPVYGFCGACPPALCLCRDPRRPCGERRHPRRAGHKLQPVRRHGRETGGRVGCHAGCRRSDRGLHPRGAVFQPRHARLPVAGIPSQRQPHAAAVALRRLRGRSLYIRRHAAKALSRSRTAKEVTR